MAAEVKFLIQAVSGQIIESIGPIDSPLEHDFAGGAKSFETPFRHLTPGERLEAGSPMGEP